MKHMGNPRSVLCYGFVQSEFLGDGTWTDAYTLKEEHAVLSNDLEQAGLCFEKHGYSTDPEYYLSIREATFESDPNGIAPRYPLAIDPDRLVIKPEWEQRLRTYAEQASIDLGDQKPEWYLLTLTGE